MCGHRRIRSVRDAHEMAVGASEDSVERQSPPGQSPATDFHRVRFDGDGVDVPEIGWLAERAREPLGQQRDEHVGLRLHGASPYRVPDTEGLPSGLSGPDACGCLTGIAASSNKSRTRLSSPGAQGTSRLGVDESDLWHPPRMT